MEGSRRLKMWQAGGGIGLLELVEVRINWPRNLSLFLKRKRVKRECSEQKTRGGWVKGKM